MVSSYAPDRLDSLYAPFNYSVYVDRAAISAVLNGQAVSFLPNGAELRALDQSLISNRPRPLGSDFRRYKNWIDGSVMPDVQTEWGRIVAAPANIEFLKAEINLLRRRLDMLRDPNADGRCE